MSAIDPYKALGVSAAKEEVHEALKELEPTLFPNAFCQVVDDGDDIAVIHADGAGTKSIVAYLAYRESGNADVFEGISVDSAVMNIDDMLCVGATDNFLLSNTIGRHSQRVPGDVLKAIVRGYRRFAEKISKYGVSITLCGGETADIGDLVKTVIVDSTAYSRFSRDKMIDCSGISDGLVIVGLESSGKASYEEHFNSGISSNGFTVARHALLNSSYAINYPETFSETLSSSQVYRGRFSLENKLPNSPFTIKEALLSPTRTYAPIIKKILSLHHSKISGLVHCTGGALTKCLNFGQGIHYIKDNLFEMPAVFREIQRGASISNRDMWRIFNCGHRMEIYCDRSIASEIIQISQSFDVDAKIIGRTEQSGSIANRLTIVNQGNIESY